jgi:hypothetical protein
VGALLVDLVARVEEARRKAGTLADEEEGRAVMDRSIISYDRGRARGLQDAARFVREWASAEPAADGATIAEARRDERRLCIADMRGEIDGERKYQQGKWGTVAQASGKPLFQSADGPEGCHEPGAFLCYMQHYHGEAVRLASTVQGTEAARDTLRKVVALGVACLEQHAADGLLPATDDPRERGSRRKAVYRLIEDRAAKLPAQGREVESYLSGMKWFLDEAARQAEAALRHGDGQLDYLVVALSLGWACLAKHGCPPRGAFPPGGPA